MAKLRFGSGSACPAMYPEQEGVNKKYQLLERIKDDSNNEIGTVSGFFTDADGVEYAVVCLDAQYRKYNESGEELINSSGYITNLGTYTSQDLYRTKKTSTYNTQTVLDYCAANEHSSTGCTYCRSLSFTIDGITYYGQYPNIPELLDMIKIVPALNQLDTTASTYSDKIFDNQSLQSSNEGSDYNMWTINYNGEIRNQTFKWSSTGMLVPVLEIPNAATTKESATINLTVTLNKDRYSQNQFGSFTINGNTYTQVDFTNNIMTIQIPSSTSLPWTASIAYNDGETVMSPSSGTINSSTDTNLTIRIWNMSPSSDDPGIDPGGDGDF